MMQFGRTWAVVVALLGLIAGFVIGLFSFWADPVRFAGPGDMVLATPRTSRGHRAGVSAAV